MTRRREGQPATPAEVVLRLLVLKHLKTWSYEQLEWEVRGSVAYRHFCRLGSGTVPDGKTLVRLGQLLEGDLLRAVHERVVGVAVERRVTRGRRLRVDTTVVEAPIRYPTDSGLCEDGIRVLRRGVRRLEPADERDRPGIAAPGRGGAHGAATALPEAAADHATRGARDAAKHGRRAPAATAVTGRGAGARAPRPDPTRDDAPARATGRAPDPRPHRDGERRGRREERRTVAGAGGRRA